MIFKYIKNSSDNFFINILGLYPKECKTKRYTDLYCSEISIYKNDEKYDIVFFFKKDTINLISEVMLYDKNPDEQSILDLLKEMANLIAGSAKTLLEEFDEISTYKISTPKYIGKVLNTQDIKLSKQFGQKIQNRCFVFGIKEK